MVSKIESAYNVVKYLLNKDQRNKITPEEFNSFALNGLYKLYADILDFYRLQVARQNRYVSGQGLSKQSRYTQQQIEYYRNITDLLTVTDDFIDIPEDVSFVTNIITDKRVSVEKTDSDYFDLIMGYRRKPGCIPIYRIVNNKYEFSPEVDKVKISYLRKLKTPKWTYNPVNEQPLFNPDADDYQDLDIHESLFYKAVEEICIEAGINIREFDIEQLIQNNKQLQYQKDTLQ